MMSDPVNLGRLRMERNNFLLSFKTFSIENCIFPSDISLPLQWINSLPNINKPAIQNPPNRCRNNSQKKQNGMAKFLAGVLPIIF